MADIIDTANDLVEQTLELALVEARANIKPEAQAIGSCLWCGQEHLEEGRRWCDSDCRDQWSKWRHR